MHYFIVIIIIAVIVIIQLHSFTDTKHKIASFLWIFPEKKDAYQLEKEAVIKEINQAKSGEIKKMIIIAGLNPIKYYITRKDEDGNLSESFSTAQAREDLIKNLSSNTSGISVSHSNSTLQTIVISINDYLKNNKTVSDFHLMKDIVDRNCDSKEEEISAQIPIPLYMGLVGTMAGILIGILYLWLSGGISDLLSTGGGSGADGVEALLGGVALAMISSILGIILTTSGSNKFKTAKSHVESNKHAFLSWIQATLLPTLSDNVVGAIREMTGNLENFNKEFAQNTGNLGRALEKVNESYKLQTQLIDAVNKIQEGRTAATNLTLMSKLIESSDQIGQLAEYLHNTNDYLANVRALNEKLDQNEQRTQTIEEIGAFFKTELQQIESRKGVIAQSVGKVDDYLQQTLQKLNEHTVSSLQELQKSSVKQQDILLQKNEEINKIITELKNLTEVKKAISGFESAIKGQNSKIDNLTNAITALANAKTKSDGTNTPISIKPKMKLWKILLNIFGSVLGGSLLLALLIANWDSMYNLITEIFRF